MRVLIIGYGSIGKRHYSVLSNLNNIESVSLVSKQKNIDSSILVYERLDIVDDLDAYHYFVIASETHKHYDQLKYLENRLKGKIIFCEKPLFETQKELEITRNRVFVGYVLRYHPLLQKLREALKNENIINVNINCAQYLPLWRPNQDYRTSYSASKSKGGGVLLDLSHELDYLQWIFGKLTEVKSYQLKISDLEIDSDDMVIVIGKTEKNVMVTLSIDYISKISKRRLLVDSLEKSFELDLLTNTFCKNNKNNKEDKIKVNAHEKNYMFEQMHKDILGEAKYACTYAEASLVMDTVVSIQEQNI